MTTITREAYLAICQQVFKARPSVQRILRGYAEKIVEDATSMGLRPHGGGMVQDHYAGKLAEACFEYYLHRYNIPHVCRCRGLFDEEGAPGRVDYLVWMDGDFRDADVKSGTLPTTQRFEDVDIDGYGLTVPVVQAKDSSCMVYPHVFLNSLLSEAVFVGWAFKWEVSSLSDGSARRVCPGVNGKPEFYKVPVAELHHPRELFQLSAVTRATESLEKIMANY